MSTTSKATPDASRKNYQGTHILTDDFSSSTDTWISGINNNVLVFGPSGSGKTRHYVKPNILHSHESMIILDTKGSLCEETGLFLEDRGFIVKNIDFTDLKASTGYNPLAYIRYDEKTDRYNEQDILSLCCALVEDSHRDDPFWGNAARQYLACIISYVLEAMPRYRHTIDEAVKLISCMHSDEFDARMEELNALKPGNTTSLRYESFKTNIKAEKMDASIRGILSTNLDTLVFDDAQALYRKPDQIDFASLGRRKTALFLTVSDTDRSMDRLVGAFMTQALQSLCRSADKDYPLHRLPVPVRFYLDDFATNYTIKDFDKVISVIRSREISVSVILQSMTQLASLYGDSTARTIVQNCDMQLYLGGSDLETAGYISRRANRTLTSILDMPIDEAYLLVRGQKARISRKYDLSRLTLENGQTKTQDQPGDVIPQGA